MRVSIFFVGALVLASACATGPMGPQTREFLAEPRTLPSTVEIRTVPFIKQSENFCGPATLAMAMAASGEAVPVETLGREMMTPGKRGTLQEDLLGASRRHGRLAVNIYGIPAMLTELAAGNPVIVFQNLGLSWYPRWHYAIALGYDLDRQQLILHSGADEFLREDLEHFERTWALGRYWGLVLLEPGSGLPVTASDLAVSAGGAGLEQAGMIAEAEMVYRQVLLRWPDSLAASIGMGNIRYFRGEYAGAAEVLLAATRSHPEQAVLWHNLATAQGAAGRDRDARISAARALQLADASEAVSYRISLRDWL